MKRTAIVFSVVVVIGFGVTGYTQSAAKPAASPIVGAWKIVEGPGGRGTQASLWLFTEKHFSRIGIQGPRAPFKNPGAPSAEDKAAAYDSFNANAGTYEVKGNTIIFRVQMAKSQGIVGQDLEQQLEVKGSTMTVKNPNNGATFRLTRLD